MPSISYRLFIILFTLAAFTGFAQPKKLVFSLKPDWLPISKSVLPTGEFSSLGCRGCGFDGHNSQTAVWQEFLPGMQAENLSLKNDVWDEVPFWEIAALDTLFLKEDRNAFRIFPSERKKTSGSRLEIRLVRAGKNGWEKLRSAEIEVSGSTLRKPYSGIPDAITSQPNSIFANGIWVKIGLTRTGVYQLRHSDLQALGLDLEGKSSGKIRMFGSGGKQLSESNRDYDFKDIREIPIQVEDGGDGVFNQSDRIFFYGEDPHTWTLNTRNKAYEFRNNIYSDTSYYFISFTQDAGGKRVAQINSDPSPAVSLSHYPDHWIYAPDKINVLSLGRAWYADAFDFNTSKDLSFSASGLNPDSVLRLRFGIMARSGIKYPFRFQVNGTLLNDTAPEPVNLNSAFGFYGREISALRYFKASPGTSSLNVNISYQKSGNPESIGYLNFVEVTGWRSLDWRSKGFGFRSFEHKGSVVNYQLGNLPQDSRIWDVSRKDSIRQIALSGNSFSILHDTLKEFYAFSPSDLLSPELLQRMSNQNLRGLATPTLLIVSHPSFLDQAYRLADFRRNHDKMDVEVVTHQQVYNEFSSGAQDITAIRNFAMHLYYKNPDSSRLRYLLLFGDASFDFKNRVEGNSNFMPTYESPSSLYILSSYASDDYFGILAKGKGGWEANDMIDVGVGRLPCKDETEARVLVDKLIHYGSSKKCLGRWRNRYTFVADNGDYCEHSRQSNELSESLLFRNNRAIVKKLFIGAYERIAGAGGYTSPAATNDLLSSIEKGNLIVNYTGHGGETVWADEFLFTSEMIDKLQNYDNLSFFITATCDFGRHDNPGQLSGAESLLLNSKGGAIGIMTTGRPVGSANNFAINQSFYQTLFKPLDGKYGRMGDAIREAKNNNSDKISNRGFTLLGDPSAAFAFPEEEISITSIKDTVRGLDLVEVEGEIRDNTGSRDSSFQGRAFATLLDRPGVLSIIDGEPCTNINYPYQRSVLYNGSSAVKDGRFSMKFYVSADISYLTGNGRVSLYAMDTTAIRDASGFRTNLKVGGLNPNPISDQTGPQIRLFMNDTNFVNYGLTGENADLLVFLHDSESGINATGLGLGHDLVAVLDEEQTFILNEFFENDEGSFQSGRLRFPLRGLSAGIHKIRVKAWDNFNNSAEAIIYFEVGISGVNNLIAKEVKVYPNPFTDKVYFQMESAFAGENAKVEVEILDLTGRVVATKGWDFETSSSRPGADGELSWDGRGPGGELLKQGLYFCRIRLKSDTDDGEFKITKKMILIR
jgi:hypothetical protein